MPIGGSRRMGWGTFIDPGLMKVLLRDGVYPQLCTLEAPTITRSAFGDAVTTWAGVDGYINIPCRKFDRLPHEDRDVSIIEELKYWTIALGGYFPNIDAAWRVRMGTTTEIYAIDGIDGDSLHFMTLITAHLFIPSEEVGVMRGTG